MQCSEAHGGIKCSWADCPHWFANEGKRVAHLGDFHVPLPATAIKTVLLTDATDRAAAVFNDAGMAMLAKVYATFDSQPTFATDTATSEDRYELMAISMGKELKAFVAGRVDPESLSPNVI